MNIRYRVTLTQCERDELGGAAERGHNCATGCDASHPM